jgi:hypothetical protein
MNSLFRVLTGYSMFLVACSADSSQSAALEGRQLLSQEIRQTFDELARPDGACLSGRLGNDKSCETSAAWKQYLAQACAAHGMQVESTSPTQSCGSDQFRYAEFSCCPQSAPAVAPNCTQLAEGGPSICQPIADWKLVMTAACAGRGLQLAETYFGESCGADAVHSVSYSCCGAQPLPPAAEDCQSFSAGGAGVCQTPEEWKRADITQCESKGLSLSDISLSGDCGSGSFSNSTSLCCGGRSTPAPTPTCTSTVYDTPGCRDEAAWRKVASDLCAKQSLTLSAIAFTDACGAGLWQNMKYACCPTTTDPPPPPPSLCTTQLLDEGGACNDQATWRDRAVRACATAGAVLKELTFGTPCATDKYLQAKANCCP